MSKFSSVVIFVATLLISGVVGRHPGVVDSSRNDIGALGEEALRLATPKQQREMNELVVERKGLLKEKIRLEDEAGRVNDAGEDAMAAIQIAGRELTELKAVCSGRKSESLIEVCRSLVKKQQVFLQAKVRLEGAKKAIEENTMGYKAVSRKLENLNNDMESVRFLPRPSVPVCRGSNCRVICKHGSCWCVCGY